MNIHLLVPSAFHEKLKCSLCKNYLSCFPISVCSNTESVCGRCTVPEGRICYQDEAFQTICQFLKFPCRYQSEGCPKELQPNHMPWHEENCPYRVVPCFINKPTPCIWKGSLPNLLPHCRAEHSEIILKSGEFQLDLATSEMTESLIEYDKQLLIFRRKFKPKSKMLYCAICHNPYHREIANYACQLSITGDNKILSLNFNTTSFKEMILTSLCLKAIGDENNTALLCKITIGKAESGDLGLQISPEVNLHLLSFLKCCECSDFAIPPIFNCVENMNALCSSCSLSHLRSCKPCAECQKYRQRNFHLEKIADIVYYPCKYQKNGCSGSYKYDLLDLHHKSCEYRDDICPFLEFELCKWKGLNKDICDHVVNNHRDIMLESSEVALVLSLEMKTPQCKIIRFSNRLFRLVFCVDEDKRYMWSVEMIGCHEYFFKFVIDIIDPIMYNKKLLKSQYCWRLSKKDDLFNNGVSYCYFLNDQICDFAETESGQVTFNVHIFK